MGRLIRCRKFGNACRMNSAADGLSLELSRVICRHAETNAAVGGCYLEALPFPAIAGEFDRYAAVGGTAMNITADSSQVQAAIYRFELQIAGDVADGNAAVLGSQVYRRAGGDKDFIAYRPLVFLVAGRAVGTNVASGGLDEDLKCQVPSLAIRGSIGVHLGAHQDIGAVPTVDRDAAIWAGIDGKYAAGGNALLPHFAERRAVLVPAVVAIEGRLGLGEGRHAEEKREGNIQVL